MSPKIHPLATVHPNARLGEDVEVGPYAYIDEFVTLGDRCKILPHATIFNYAFKGAFNYFNTVFFMLVSRGASF